jgi:hypothetical protein
MLREHIGHGIGSVFAPFVTLLSKWRRARMFHPDGLVFTARVESRGPLGERLAGPALVRLSGALWRRGHEALDVLGIAVRFGGTVETALAPPEDAQDLLFATTPSPLTLGLSPFTTRSHDFFANHFWAVSPFDVDGVGRVKFRLTPEIRGGTGETRDEKLRTAVAAGEARFLLETRPTFRAGWQAQAEIVLEREADVRQGRLVFSPFRDGRGIVPRGLVHAIRKAAYPASVAGRTA